MKKMSTWQVKGMNRDMSVSKFSPEFAFENMNLRLSTNDGNTMMSWVNERGPLAITLKDSSNNTVSITGTPIGTATLNHQLVIFTHSATGDDKDFIYVLSYNNNDKTQMLCKTLYNGNLNFNTSYPLETLVSYEADHIQKVYWTDGLNQPRLINIAASDSKIAKWNASAAGVQDFFFDFVPSLSMGETVSIVQNVSSAGTFAPGVIQYCFTYINRYGQQSNIVWASSLYFLSYSDRGAAPDEGVTNSFQLTFTSIDTNYDYIRLYSIQRTSYDGEPIVKLLDDIPLDDAKTNGSSQLYVTYIDTGTSGAAMDPYELLYVGGKEITAKTLADTDNTMFLGNVTKVSSLDTEIQNYFDGLRRNSSIGITFSNADTAKQIQLDEIKGVYVNTNTLTCGDLRKISTLKGGEKYRFGLQFQKKTGEWSEPIYLDDAENTLYPSTSVVNRTINLVDASTTISMAGLNSIPGFSSTYKRVRPVIVFPTIGDRQVLCQGVLNPTVFNIEDRISNAPFAQSSWYFRPYMVNDTSESSAAYTPTITLETTSAAAFDNPAAVDALNNNSFFVSNNLYSYYYVIFVSLPGTLDDPEPANEILRRGYLRTKYTLEAWYPGYDSPQKPIYQESFQSFKGAIKIERGQNLTPIYALFGYQSWPIPKFVKEDIGETGTQYYRKETTEYLDGVLVESIDETDNSQQPFRMYNGLEVTNNGLLYYRKPDITGAPDRYDFYFCKTESLYSLSSAAAYLAKFTKVDTDFNVITDNLSGNSLEFTHYKSLPTAVGIIEANGGSAVGSNQKARSKIEIQGSKCVYATPFGGRITNPMFQSNSEFFVDQSIITMHSPDIEFDSEVQTFATDGYKLRIIGAVPITSNISAHSIQTSSSMLEKNHNVAGANLSFGVGELGNNIRHDGIDIYAGNRLVSDYLWDDVYVSNDTSKDDKIVTSESAYDYLIYPWQRNGSLNNDNRTADVASSWLKLKKESNLLYSYNTVYLASAARKSFTSISAQMFLTENNFIHNMRLPKQMNTSSDINYYPNIDKVLYNTQGYPIYTKQVNTSADYIYSYSPVSMKYKSTSHAVIALKGSPIPILPYGYDYTVGSTHITPGKYVFDQSWGTSTRWGDTNVSFTQDLLDINTLFGNTKYNYLWIGELYKEVLNPFGGTSKSALRNNKWTVAGDALNLPASGNLTITWTEGDTFYQRYDCLKTYAFTTEDTNQLVEILSFMCESRVNIDGRYDRNRGQTDNTNMRPEIFNLLNPVYSQRNNFFTSSKIFLDENDEQVYPNLITYSKTKTPGADVDLYTNVTLASTLDLDGDKGEITALRRFNDQLIAFQDTGISHILYNVSAAIATTAGVPVELANSGKVEGKKYITDTIGCSNKESIVATPSGIYFMDSHDKSIYLFNGQLQNLSIMGGMNSWVKNNMPSPEVKWNPASFGNFKTFYDRLNQDVLFVNNEKALAWSEKLSAFTSFYNYEGTPYFNNLDNTGIWVRSNGTLWKHNAGSYSNFFGVNKPYWMTLVGNPEPQTDKTFTNLEFRADVEGEGTSATAPYLPFDYLETWSEYQHGIANLSIKNGIGGMMHNLSDKSAALKRKFRMWRCDIPRDNATVDAATEAPMGIKRFSAHPIDRMRNPWLYLKLKKNIPTSGTLPRTEIHDVLMTYFD